MASWYLVKNEKRIGPVEESELSELDVTRETLVWCSGMSDWQPAGSVPELTYLFAGSSAYDKGEGTPPPPPFFSTSGPSHNDYRQNTGESYIVTDKSKVAAGVLAILLGGLGVHYFYLGKVGAGLVSILLSFVTCGIWPLVMLAQGIIMLTMSDSEFQRKYVDNPAFMPLF